MRKTALLATLLLAAFATLAGASVASADDKHPKPSPTREAPAEHEKEHEQESEDEEDSDVVNSDGDSDEERRAHHELEIKYGKDGAFQIPPLVIKPGVLEPDLDASIKGASVNGAGSTSQVGSPSQVGSNGQVGWVGPGAGAPNSGPNGGATTTIAVEPIDFSKVVFGQNSPAENFFTWSTVALVATATGALGIAGYFVVSRPARARLRDSEVEYTA